MTVLTVSLPLSSLFLTHSFNSTFLSPHVVAYPVKCVRVAVVNQLYTL